MSESLTDLARARKAMGLTVAELATRIGASRQSVYNWEHGVSTPNPMALRAIAATFFLPPETIETWFNKAA